MYYYVSRYAVRYSIKSLDVSGTLAYRKLIIINISISWKSVIVYVRLDGKSSKNYSTK